MIRHLLLALLAASLLVTAGCGRDETQSPEQVAAATTSPKGAVDASVKALRQNDLNALLRATLPEKEFHRIGQLWQEGTTGADIDDDERMQFAMTMGMLTADGAEEALMAMLEPQLAELDKQMAQLPLMIGMGRGVAASMIEQNEDLNQAQKEQVQKSLDALAGWVQKTPFTDRDRARRAVAVVTRTARSLELSTLDELHALSFEEALTKGGMVLGGLKGVLDIYDLSIDRVLDSVKASVVSESGDEAKVRIDWTLLDAPLSIESDMVRQDGRWFSRDTLDQLARADAEGP
ncbi:MAG TPA: hypothetical protein PKZ76_03825 [Xanthomonadaceae bacterium]|nr:hypothetical protein [Xanthomonadaceae bacterium]